MRVIDAHAHLHRFPGYLESLLEVMDAHGIERCCISGLGKLFRCVDNDGVKEVIKKYPKRFIGAVYIRPGVDSHFDIKKAHEEGFKMVKVTIPKKPYDDVSFFPLWETAQELKMPILFHTGVITMLLKAPEEHISSWFMHPMRIEPITNAFPDLKVIIAHLGVHWNEDAAELIRMRPNVYADITGSPDGWRVRADMIGFDKLLWWSKAFEKLIFGTDVHFAKISQILNEDKARLKKYNINQKTQEKYFFRNILKLLGDKA